MSVTTAPSGAASAIRPFHVDVPEETIDDLRRRIAATRLPEKETVGDQTQGVQLATIARSRAAAPTTTTSGGSRRG